MHYGGLVVDHSTFPPLLFWSRAKNEEKNKLPLESGGRTNQNNVDDNLLASNIVHVIMVLISRQRM